MIRVDIKRTDFYNELNLEKQKEYFYNKNNKFLPKIDNIYYSIFLECDSNENHDVTALLYKLENMKRDALASHEPQDFGRGLMVDTRDFSLKYG